MATNRAKNKPHEQHSEAGRPTTARPGVRSSRSSGVGPVRAVRASEARLLEALRETPRRSFVPSVAGEFFSDDRAVPLGRDRSIPPTGIVTMMLRALDLEGTERVLVVGGGSGYQAALLSCLAREVVSVESDEGLVNLAAATLEKLGRYNVRIVHADALAGWPSQAPYDAIVFGGAVSQVPHALIDQLALGGRLVIPLGDAECQLVQRLHKRVDGLDAQTIGACHIDMLTSPRPNGSLFPWSSRQR